MLARYINLKEAHERREVLERRVEALPAREWQVQRFEAIHSSDQACQKLTGRITPAEKACLLSHRSLLTEMLQAGVREPFMVWEDDVEVGACAHQAVMGFVSRTDPAQWDVLFTDLIVPDLLSMLQLLVRGRPLRTRKEVEVLDLSRMSFAGASAYLVNPLSLAKVTDLLHAGTSLDEPYDLLLRRLIHEGKIKGNALFPFVTTVSEGSLASQIQPGDTSPTDLAWTLFRRLSWMESDPEELYPWCNRLSVCHPDPESSVMGVIAAALLSPQFKPK
jgi:GR25 family glycosyltransferase involved in LPS biosynthesis